MEEKNMDSFLKVIEYIAEETKRSVQEINNEIEGSLKRAAKDYQALIKLWETKSLLLKNCFNMQTEMYHTVRSFHEKVLNIDEPKIKSVEPCNNCNKEKEIWEDNNSEEDDTGDEIVLDLTNLSDEEALAKAVEFIKKEFAKW